MSDAHPSSSSTRDDRLPVLDGWRGISIALVLWGHLFPAGPKNSGMNEAFAQGGMVLFFTLSGFLITTFLLRRPDPVEFLIRRIFRILPLAWLFSIIVLLLVGADGETWLAHLFFYLNVPPGYGIQSTAHFWSLCVEVHFYAGIALLVAIAGRKGLYLVPFVAVCVTGYRIATDTPLSNITWLRVDEILAGALLALTFHRLRGRFSWRPPVLLTAAMFALVIASAHPGSGALQYLRPYLSAILIGSTLFSLETPVVRLLCGRVLGYLALTSYALYVIHGGLMATWLGSGEGLAKYAKRPLLVAATFALAHLSTHLFEARFIDMGHKLAARVRRRRESRAGTVALAGERAGRSSRSDP